MSREGKHIDILFLDVYMDMTDSLNGIGMEDNALFFTYSTYLGDRLDAADLVVCVHDSYKSRIIADSVSYIFRIYHTLVAYGNVSYLKALLFEILAGMENCMVLENRSNDVLFASLCEIFRNALDSPVIGL